MIDKLIAELEAATEGSRELSDDVLLACGWVVDEEPNPFDYFPMVHKWTSPAGEPVHLCKRPDPTRSLDAALTLVPERCGWNIGDSGESCVFRKIERPNNEPGWPVIGDCGEAATPALSLCIAALKARQAMEQAA